jgi:uncharacterized membrane protein
MKYLKYTSFLFLILAVVLVVDGFMKRNDPEGGAILSFIFAAVCIFMFFFRRNMAKRFEDRNKRE